MATLNYEAGNVRVVHNDAGNNVSSVTVTTEESTPDFFARAGSNRGDFNVQIGPGFADDAANGILITSVRENGRDNLDVVGTRYSTSQIDVTGGGYYVPVHDTIGDEANVDFAAGYFPYAEGWIGGRVSNSANNGNMTTISGSPGLVLNPTTLTFRQGLNGYNGATDGLIRADGTSDFTSGSAFLDGPGTTAENIHGLFRFDNIIGASAGQIPAGSTIASARLSVRTTTVGSAESTGPFNVHQL